MPWLFARCNQFLLVEQLRREFDDRFMSPIVFAQQNFAREIVRIVIVQTLQQRNVQLSLLGKVGEQLRRHLHVVSGQDDSGFFGAKRQRHDRFTFHCLCRFIQEDVGKVSFRQIEGCQFHRNVQRNNYDAMFQNILHRWTPKVAHIDVQVD